MGCEKGYFEVYGSMQRQTVRWPVEEMRLTRWRLNELIWLIRVILICFTCIIFFNGVPNPIVFLKSMTSGASAVEAFTIGIWDTVFERVP